MSKNNFDATLQISTFFACVRDNRFDDGTLEILESVVMTASKDVKTMMEVRRRLRDLLTNEESVVSRILLRQLQLAGKNNKSVELEQQLCICDFFVRAFALAGDFQSCLALKYEALVLRQLKSPTNQWIEVSYEEWLTFAQHSLDIGFSSIAAKACENALMCFPNKNAGGGCKTPVLHEHLQIINKIKILRDIAVTSAASSSGTGSRLLEKEDNREKQKKAFFTICRNPTLSFSKLFVQEWDKEETYSIIA